MMRAAVTPQPGRLELQTLPDPEPGGQTLVRILRAGLCGTDTKVLDGSISVKRPLILGHELVGEVVVPEDGSPLAVGDKVLVDPSLSCDRCVQCRHSRPHLCSNGGLMGREVDGGIAELVAIGERRLLPIPETVPLDNAPLLQVLGTCTHGQERITGAAGQSGAVIGLGVTGLLHVQLLSARGISPIVAITRSQEKLEIAKQLGAHITVTPDEAGAAVAEATDGNGVDVVVESVGKIATLRQAIDLAAPGADLLVYGLINETDGQLPFYDIYFKELRLIASRAALAGDYQRAIDLLAARKVQFPPLVSASFPLDRTHDAFEAMSGPGTLKILLSLQ